MDIYYYSMVIFTGIGLIGTGSFLAVLLYGLSAKSTNSLSPQQQNLLSNKYNAFHKKNHITIKIWVFLLIALATIILLNISELVVSGHLLHKPSLILSIISIIVASLSLTLGFNLANMLSHYLSSVKSEVSNTYITHMKFIIGLVRCCTIAVCIMFLSALILGLVK